MSEPGYFDRIGARAALSEPAFQHLAPTVRIALDPLAEDPSPTFPDAPVIAAPPHPAPAMTPPTTDLLPNATDPTEGQSDPWQPSPVDVTAQSAPEIPFEDKDAAPDMETEVTPELRDIIQAPPDVPELAVKLDDADPGSVPEPSATAAAPILATEAPAEIRQHDPDVVPLPTRQDSDESPTAPFERFIERIAAPSPADVSPIEPQPAPDRLDAPPPPPAPRLQIGEVRVELIGPAATPTRNPSPRIRRATGGGAAPRQRFGLGQL